MKKLIILWVTLIVLIVGCAPDVAKDQIYTVGIAGWNSDETYQNNINGFINGLEQENFIEGKNIKYLIQFAESDVEKHKVIVTDFVENDVDLIYSLTTPGTLAAKEVTNTIPIVFSIVTYPQQAGLIASIENSENNLVGTRNFVSIEEQFSYYNRIFTSLEKVVFVHRKDEPNSDIQLKHITEYLLAKDVEIIDLAAVDLDDIASQLQLSIKEIDVIYLACDTLINNGAEELIIEIANTYKKPVIGCLQSSVKKGALIGVVSDFYEIGKLSGRKASLILQGAKPSSLLTESGNNNLLTINTNSAENLDIVLPSTLLGEADDIIN